MQRRAERPVRNAYEGYLSKATREAGFSLFGQMFALGFGFVAQAVYARYLGADLVGVYVLAWTIVMAVTTLTTLGFEGGFVRYVSMYRGQGRDREAASVVALGIRVALVASLVGTAAVVATRGIVARGLFGDPRLERVLVVMSLAVIPYTFMRLGAAVLRAYNDIKLNTVSSVILLLVPRLLLFIVLFYFGARVMGLVTATVVACIVSAAATWRFVRRLAPTLFSGGPRASIPKREITAYSSTILAETATGFALSQTGRIVLGVNLTASDVGIFNIVPLLASLVAVFSVSFNAIFSPMIADIYHRGDTDLMKLLLRTITRWVFLLALPAFAWLLLSGEGILSIFGDEFVRGYPALGVLAVAWLIENAGGSVASCLAMTRYQKFNVLNIAVMAGVSVVLNIILVPRMGILGVNVARVVEGRVLLGILPFDRSFIKVGASAVILFGLVLALRTFVEIPRDWYWTALTLVLCYVVGAASIFLMGFKDEDRMIWSLILRKLLRRA
jgi:O-antigen/teichoic acid export membrane protein